MHLRDRLARMGLIERRATPRRDPEVDEAVKHSATQVDRTRELVDELSRLEVIFVPRSAKRRR